MLVVLKNEEPRRKQRGIGSNRSSNRSKLRGINPREIKIPPPSKDLRVLALPKATSPTVTRCCGNAQTTLLPHSSHIAGELLTWPRKGVIVAKVEGVYNGHSGQ